MSHSTVQSNTSVKKSAEKKKGIYKNFISGVNLK